MLTPAPIAVASPAKNAYRGVWVANATAKIGASEDSDPSISPLRAGCARCNRNVRWACGLCDGGGPTAVIECGRKRRWRCSRALLGSGVHIRGTGLAFSSVWCWRVGCMAFSRLSWVGCFRPRPPAGRRQLSLGARAAGLQPGRSPGLARSASRRAPTRTCFRRRWRVARRRGRGRWARASGSARRCWPHPTRGSRGHDLRARRRAVRCHRSSDALERVEHAGRFGYLVAAHHGVCRGHRWHHRATQADARTSSTTASHV